MHRAFALVGLLAATAASAGCLYTETINTPPQAEISVAEERAYFRGDEIAFSAGKSSDDDGDPLFFAFSAEVCADGGTPCEDLVDLAADRARLRVELPLVLSSQPDLAVALVRASVVVTDGRGAFSSAQASWPVDNAPPEVELDPNGPGLDPDIYPVGLPTYISAKVEDVDDDPSEAVLEWRVSDRPLESQTGAFTFQEVTGPTVVSPTYELIPDVAGIWEITVAVTDAAGTTVEATELLNVTGDTPPCIAATSPSTSLLVLVDADAAPKSFSVLQVLDELDAYPATAYGEAEFRWMRKDPGASDFAGVGDNTAAMAIDPALYAPGDEIELRVEVLDREPAHEPLCPEGEATCSVEGNSCLQRLTWSIEIR